MMKCRKVLRLWALEYLFVIRFNVDCSSQTRTEARLSELFTEEAGHILNIDELCLCHPSSIPHNADLAYRVFFFIVQ